MAPVSEFAVEAEAAATAAEAAIVVAEGVVKAVVMVVEAGAAGSGNGLGWGAREIHIDRS